MKPQKAGPLAEPLTNRETEVLHLIAAGLSNREIGEQFSLTLHTVKWYIKEIFGKLQVRRRTEAVALARQLGLLANEAQSSAHPHNLPAPATPFIGRRQELATLTSLLADTTQRLITITGLGGMGKTRLAIEAVARHLPTTQKQVAFIALEAARSEAELITTIAKTLRIQFHGQRELKEQLLNALRNQRRLLVLDNFEHLFDCRPLLHDLLHTAPNLRILVTSRQSLNLYGETCCLLAGMVIDDPTDESASDLFMVSAQRARPTLDREKIDASTVRQICRMVEGMPLAIELAAGWMGMLTPVEIADGIASNIVLLQTNAYDVPQRHTSVEALFTHTWRMLSDNEQNGLARLSIFRGGFDRIAAAEVAHLSLPVFRILIEKALVLESDQGRFKLHELLRQFMAEKLAERAIHAQQASNEHSHYYCRLLATLANNLQHASEEDALAVVERDLDNIRSAWNWAVDHRQGESLMRAAYMLYTAHLHYGRYKEGIAVFAAAAQTCSDATPADQHRRARLLAFQGVCTWYQGSPDETHQIFLESRRLVDTLAVKASAADEVGWTRAFLMSWLQSVGAESMQAALAVHLESLAFFRHVSDQREIARLLTHIGSLHNLFGQIDESKAALEESLAISQTLGNPGPTAEALHYLAAFALNRGHFTRSNEQWLAALAIAERINYRFGAAHYHFRLGMTTRYLGDFSQAAAYLQGALWTFEELEDLDQIKNTLHELAVVNLHRGNYGEAMRYGEQALAVVLQPGWDPLDEANVQGVLDNIRLATGQPVAAHPNLDERIAIWRDTGSQQDLSQTLTASGYVGWQQDDEARATDHNTEALAIAIKTQNSWLLLTIAPFIAYHLHRLGRSEPARRFYAELLGFAFIAKSQWFQDLFDSTFLHNPDNPTGSRDHPIEEAQRIDMLWQSASTILQQLQQESWARTGNLSATNLSNARGLTPAQIAVFKELGAVEN